MKLNEVVAAVVLGMVFAGAASAATPEEPSAATVTFPSSIDHQVKITRPPALPALYVTLAALQGWDVYSTSAAMKTGAREANPLAAPLAGNTGALLGLKAVTTASTIFFTERVWKKNRVAAVVLMSAINGATAAMAMHNIQNARNVSTR